ncbi:MAG: class I SAM-dependent methyltransferase [Planctomycetota bacterium]|nr:class I SAM-dependent methyltransferase [Planctomycetota bacterium]
MSTNDALFSFIEQLQAGTPWESVLDAGTGSHSLEWISGLPTSRWTGVTGEARVADRLRREFSSVMRPVDRIACGDWSDPLFLQGETFSVVVADYLLGALDGFAPYFQDRLFERLRRHVGTRMYVVGLAPYPGSSDHPWGQVVVEVARLRDACILLAGHRCYREYALDWTLRQLEAADFVVEETRVFPIRYGLPFVDEQLDVCLRKLPSFRDQRLAASMRRSVESLRERAHSLHAIHRGASFGEDYVVYARPRPRD